MKIHTLQPLELAENYVRDVWWESDCGDLRQGPPTNSARLQGVSGREYVFDPSRLGRLEIAHYTSIDHPRIYTSPSYSAFIVGDDCIATNDPQYIPAPSPPAPGSPPNVRRNAAMEAALRARYPDNYLQVQVIQPRPGAPSWVYYHRILEDGSCSSPGRSS